MNISLSTIDNIIAHWEKFAKTYFWHSPSNASQRRDEEARQSKEWDFLHNDIKYHVRIQIRCTCKNYYVERIVFIKGIPQKCGLRLLKKIRKELI